LTGWRTGLPSGALGCRVAAPCYWSAFPGNWRPTWSRKVEKEGPEAFFACCCLLPTDNSVCLGPNPFPLPDFLLQRLGGLISSIMHPEPEFDIDTSSQRISPSRGCVDMLCALPSSGGPFPISPQFVICCPPTLTMIIWLVLCLLCHYTHSLIKQGKIRHLPIGFHFEFDWNTSKHFWAPVISKSSFETPKKIWSMLIDITM